MTKIPSFWLPLLALLFAVQACLASTAPRHCRRLHTDVDWPSFEEWKAAIPGIIKQNNSDSFGSLPDYRIRAKCYSEVQAAVKFAALHKIRLSVITTGHDALGRNIAGSGLIIDLSLLQSARVSRSFAATARGVPNLKHHEKPQRIVPTDGIQAAVTFNPAFNGLELNKALVPSGVFVVGGTYAGVAAAGGFGQSGGYGPLTAQYGLGVDQWLEAKVVTPDGKLVVANEVSNPELFWAIRGGGGSTFGVVVEATFKAHPKTPILSFYWYINSTLSTNESDTENGHTPTSQAMTYLLSELPKLHDKGISAYVYVFPEHVRCHAVHPGQLANASDANAIWGPILTKMQSFPGMTKFQSKHRRYHNYAEFYSITYGPSEDGSGPPQNHGNIPFDSRLLSADHLRSENLSYALRDTRGNYGVLMTSPGTAVGDGKDTAVNPGWRHATVLLNGMKTNTTSVDSLRELAPGMGTYINEANIHERNWSREFWGSNYPRLSALKSKIDPEMVFWVTPGINADHMHVVDGRPCLVHPRPTKPSLYAPNSDRVSNADIVKDSAFVFGRQELIGTEFPAPGELVGLQS
ncbi:hypothetical protein ACHAPJ_012735 [Fusarium lateritium]